jgi:hypothetical protein
MDPITTDRETVTNPTIALRYADPSTPLVSTSFQFSRVGLKKRSAGLFN